MPPSLESTGKIPNRLMNTHWEKKYEKLEKIDKAIIYTWTKKKLQAHHTLYQYISDFIMFIELE